MPETSLPLWPAPNSVDILFVVYGGGHVRMVLPVAKAMQNCGHSVAIFALTTAIGPVRESGLPWFSYASLPRADSPETQAHGLRLAEGFPKDGPVPFAETVAYLGFNYWNMVQEHGAEEAARLYENSGRARFYPIHTMKALLAELQPKAVVTTSSPRSEKAAIKAAGMLGIPSLCMVDLFAFHEQAWLKNADYATEICVLNAEVRNMLISKGRPAEDIIVTGNPAFDKLQDPITIAAGQAMRKSRGWGKAGRTTVLYASAPEPLLDTHSKQPADPEDIKLPERIEAELIGFTNSHADVELVIRRHPSQSQKVPSGPRISKSTMEDDIDVLLHAVDIVVVTRSTVGLQAYLSGRPVLSVECFVASKGVSFGAYGVSRAVGSLEALPKVLAQTIRNINKGNVNLDVPEAVATPKIAARIKNLVYKAQDQA